MAEIINDRDILCRKLGLEPKASKNTAPRELLHRRYAGLPKDNVEALCLIVEKVIENKGIDIEELAGLTGLDYSRVMACCSMLQKDGILQVDLLQRCICVIFK